MKRRRRRRTGVATVVAALFGSGGSALAFSPPRATLTTPERERVVAVLHLSSEEESESDGEREIKRFPFLARALNSFRRQKEKEKIAPPVVHHEEEIRNSEVDSEASILKALATKTRLEAEVLAISLALRKVEKIERNIHDDSQFRHQQLRQLQDRLQGKGKESPLKQNSAEADDNTKSKNYVAEEILDDRPLLGPEKRDEAVAAFSELPPTVQDMMAKTVGLESGRNASLTIDKLMAEDRLFVGDDDEQFSFVAKTDFDDLDGVFIDTEFAEKSTFVSGLLPGTTRKEPVNFEQVDRLYELLGKDSFNPTSKPEVIPGGYIIRGANTMASGDVLVEKLDGILKTSALSESIQVFYILDPTPPSGEEIMLEVDESPVLLITNCNVSTDTAIWVKTLVTALGLLTICIFALSVYSQNDDGLAIDDPYPLALAVLGIQLAHEAGHVTIAHRDSIKLGLPTLVPGPLGLIGGITLIQAPPLNLKCLFDLAIAGPAVGILVSLLLMYIGSDIQVFMDPAARESLPGLPTGEFLISTKISL